MGKPNRAHPRLHRDEVASHIAYELGIFNFQTPIFKQIQIFNFLNLKKHLEFKILIILYCLEFEIWNFVIPQIRM